MKTGATDATVIEKIGSDILAYLRAQPRAKDTLKGIMEWWLLEQQISYAEKTVRQALEALVARDVLVVDCRGGTTYYSIKLGKDCG